MLTNLELLNSSEESLEWFNDNFKSIQEKYANKIIAIKDKQIVADAVSIDLLFKILKDNGIDESEILIEVVSPKNEILIL